MKCEFLFMNKFCESDSEELHIKGHGWITHWQMQLTGLRSSTQKEINIDIISL